MAKLIVHSSPLSNDGKEVIIEGGTELRKALADGGYEGLLGSPLAVSVNSHFPEELSLDYLIKEKDFIQVFRADVNGAQGDSSNKILGTLAVIAATALTIVTGGSSAPLLIKVLAAVGAAALSGLGSYLIQRAQEIPGQQTRAEVDSAANIFSVTAATNQSRGMQPMRVVMGSHRFAPDYATIPYVFYSPNGTTVDSDITSFNQSIATERRYDGNFAGLFTATNGNITIPNNGTTGAWTQSFNVPGAGATTVQLNTGVMNQQINIYQTSSPGRVIIPFYSNNITAVNEASLDANGEDWSLIGNDLISSFSVSANWNAVGSVTGSIQFSGVASVPLTIRRRVYAPTELIGLSGFTAANILNSRFYDTTGFTNASPGTYPLIGTSALSGSFAYYTIPTIVVNEIIINDALGTPDNDTNLGWIDVIDNVIYGEAVELLGNTQIHNYSAMRWISRLGNLTTSTDLEQITTASVVNPPNPFNPFALDFDGDEDNLRSWHVTLGSTFYRAYPAKYVPADASFDGNLASDQYISHIFHYGLGDLHYSDDRIKDTSMANYSFTANNIRQEAGTRVNDYVIDITPDDNTGAGSFMYPLSSNVKTDKGARLIKEPGGVNNTVTRQAPPRTIRTELSFLVHGLVQDEDTGELLPSTVNFEMNITPNTAQSGILSVKQNTNNVGGPVKSLTMAQSTPVQVTYVYENLDPNQDYTFSIIKTSNDPEEAGEVNSLELLNISYFVEDNTDYTAENREAILLAGQDSLNGQIESFNVLVESKTWKYNAGNYTWDFTRNPADWFLYTLLGIFKNPNNTIATEVFPNSSPTLNWTTGVHPDNGEKLFGAGLPIEKIDLDNIGEWAQFCIDNNLNFDNVLMDTLNIAEVLEIIANVGRATVSYQSGKIGVVWEDPNDVPVAMFGMGNIIKDSFSINYESFDIPTKIIGVYSDRDDNWQSKKVEAVVPYSVVDELNTVEVVLTGITETARAQREINLASYRRYFQRSLYTWATSVEGLVVKRADIIYLSHDLTCFSHSTRSFAFELDGSNVSRINLGDCEIEDGSNMLLIRTVDGVINNYEISVEGDGWIKLEDPLPASDVSGYLNQFGDVNPFATYGDTHPSDIMLFVGIGNDIGKRMRVISVEPGDNNEQVQITAVPEDPIIFTSEFNHIFSPVEQNPDVPRIRTRIKDAAYEQSGNRIILQVETEGATGFTINDASTGLPVLNNDNSISFSGRNGVISLVPGSHTLILNPYNHFTPYTMEPYTLVVTVD